MFKFFQKLKPREKALGVAAVSLAALSLFYRVALVPSMDRVTQVQEDLLLTLKRLAAHRRSLGQREAVLRVHEQYAHLMQAAGSDQEEASRLLKEVEALARSSGAAIVNLKSRPVESSNLVKWYRVDVEIESSLEALTRFLYQVEQSPLLLRVERLESKQDEKLASPLKTSVQISKVTIP